MAKKCRGRRKNRPPAPAPAPAEFNTGDYVLAKMKGYPAWPAKIVRPEEVELSPKPGKYPVIFFGDNSRALISQEKLSHFVSELYLDLPENTHQQRRFAKSVREIKIAIEEERTMTLREQLVAPEMEPPVRERSSETIGELILKAKAKRDWTLDRSSNEYQLEAFITYIKNSAGSVAYHQLITEQAFDIAELGYASQVTDYLIQMIVTSSYGHKIRYLHLVDLLVTEAYATKGTQGLQYLEQIEAKLTHFVNASTPAGASAADNRFMCLTVLKGWREKEIFPTATLDKYIKDLEEGSIDEDKLSDL